MDSQRPGAHKRSRSYLGLSLRPGHKSKREQRAGDGDGDNLSCNAANSVESLASYTSPTEKRNSASVSGKSPRSPMSADGSQDGEAFGQSSTQLAPYTGDGSSTRSPHRRSLAIESKSVSLEESVKMFRLIESLRNGDRAAILAVLKGSPHRMDQDDDSAHSLPGVFDGTTILHLAIQCAGPAIVQFILSQVAQQGVKLDLNSRDKDGNTPLHLASMLGRSQLVRLLMSQGGVDDSIANYQGRTPLDLARNPNVFQQLQLARSVFLDEKVNEVHSFIASGDYNGLEKLLVEHRVNALLDVNSPDLATEVATLQSGGTLLHEAARKKDTRLIQILLLNGADPFRRDRRGKLPQDVTKDERTRGVLKNSPAAAAAQRTIQERAVLGNAIAVTSAASTAGANREGTLGGKEAREMNGYLEKWTNYTTGYKLRWFVLEDGVLSYYKHQDDAGSACRGAINMRIAKLYMDPQDKTRFEIQGKSSVKYHLKANHVVEAKRWFWALNNAIQYTKDEAKEEQRKKLRETESLQLARFDPRRKSQQIEQEPLDDSGSVNLAPSTMDRNSSHRGLGSTSAITLSDSLVVIDNDSRGPESTGGGSILGDEDRIGHGSQGPTSSTELGRIASKTETVFNAGDVDGDEELDENASVVESYQATKDASNITTHSIKLQLDLLMRVAGALLDEQTTRPDLVVSDPKVLQGIESIDIGLKTMKNLTGDLLRISNDRDTYWRSRLAREAEVRKLWEESVTRIVKEQETLENKFERAEDKRKRTRKALREVLGNTKTTLKEHRRQSEVNTTSNNEHEAESVQNSKLHSARNEDTKAQQIVANKSSNHEAQWAEFSDLESNEDDEFFDAIDTGGLKVLGEMHEANSSGPTITDTQDDNVADLWVSKRHKIASSFVGYEDPIRTRLKLDADDRPKISLWGILKSMIGKDMTKMTLPVSFNEPTSLLQRVAEDMEYSDLLDMAADRASSAERMVYVAAFAASEYASTLGRVAKPFNPLLGETYEYARPDKGYRFMIEQVSHHPPISAVCAESAKWDYHGESAMKSKFYGKSFEFNPLGTWFLKLRPAGGPEELYTWKKITSSVVGIITNNPTVDHYGPMDIRNWTTGDVCNLDFKQRGWTAAGANEVKGRVLDSKGSTRWSIGGHWNDKIYARYSSGQEMTVGPPTDVSSVHSSGPGSQHAFLVWHVNPRPKGIPFNLTPFAVTLNAIPDSLRPFLPPTDTRLRPDQRAMEDGEYDFAADEKHRVEEKQRAKRREREAKGEEFKPRWFSKAKCETTGEEYWQFNGEYWIMRDEVANGGQWKGTEDIF